MAALTLDGGQVFHGRAAGGNTGGFTCGIVFNTSMTGVTELLTDPSSMGQAIVLTYPLIGNCGVCFKDFQSKRPQAAALILSELSGIESNFRSEDSLKAVLERFGIPVFTGIDTRSLVRLLRNTGARTVSYLDGGEPVKPRYQGERRSLKADEPFASVAVADTGMRRDLEEALLSLGVSLEVFPYGEEIDGPYDGYLLPGGPGDPADYDLSVVRAVMKTGKPVFGVGLGHQLLALANGARCAGMDTGHRGMNIPVRCMRSGRVFITAQNHGYTVVPDSVGAAFISHVNVNDGTVESLCWRENVFSVQFRPDITWIETFVKLLKR